MAKLHPFKALLYQTEPGSDITPLIAPPYDVINPDERDAYGGSGPHNIVHIVLPEGDDPYATAGHLLTQWLNEGTMIEEADDSFYVWEQIFNYDGSTYCRRALVAKVDCRPYAQGGVMRHELTHKGPKIDRLALYTATEVQLSQLFGVFSDEGGKIGTHIQHAVSGTPIYTAKGKDGQLSTLYRLNDHKIITQIQRAMESRTIVMADGHHRYETCLAYYESVGHEGTVLMTLVPDSDPGLIVLPTHRTVNLNGTAAEIRAALGGELKVVIFAYDEWIVAYAHLAENESISEMIALFPSENVALRINWADADVAVDDRRIGDVGILHGLILKQLMEAVRISDQRDSYHRDIVEAIDAAMENDWWAFLLRPTTISMLLDAAGSELVMPQKATYLYPKFLSGFIGARLD